VRVPMFFTVTPYSWARPRQGRFRRRTNACSSAPQTGLPPP